MHDQQYTFARFWKRALQVNPDSCCESYRGQHHGMGAEECATALRDAYLEEKVDVVGFADHWSAEGFEKVRHLFRNCEKRKPSESSYLQLITPTFRSLEMQSESGAALHLASMGKYRKKCKDRSISREFLARQGKS